MALRLVLIDEHRALREGLGLLLAGWGLEIAGSAGDAIRGAQLVRREEPDLAIVGLRLGGHAGAELARRLVAERPDRGVLLYGDSVDPGEVAAGLDAGARGYALKTGSSSELVRAIEVVAAGRAYVDPALRDAVLDPDRPGRRALSAREREILGLLADGLSGDEVAARLVLSAETVKTHVRNALAKLGARNRTHGVAIALRNGLLPR